MEIKITSKERKLNGKVEKAIVKPFGTSAHIPISRKYIGRRINILIPDKSELVWVLSNEDKKNAIYDFKKVIEGAVETKLTFHYLKIIEKIEKDTFTIEDLNIFCDTISFRNSKLSDKIKKMYSI